MKKIVWIVWEHQRRSVTLASLLADEYCEFNFGGPVVRRYAHCLLLTTQALFRNRGGVVVVQNPSMILAFYAVLLRPLLRFRLVVDRHTDALMLNRGHGTLFSVLRWMSRVTLQFADFTIVTNSELVTTVQKVGGRALILPDPFPQLEEYLVPPVEVTPEFSVFCVASWSADEPLDVYVAAARALPEVRFFISGRPRGVHQVLLENLPSNVTCTGYLSDRDYYRTMAAAHGVIAFSSQRATLVCGGYEAVTLGKPFITGSSRALKEYFTPAMYSDGTSIDLVEKIREMQTNYAGLQAQVQQFYRDSALCWQEVFAEVRCRILAGCVVDVEMRSSV